jgi:hypothetical protein
MSLDLHKLEKKLDEALNNETSQTLTKFLNDKRMTNNKQQTALEQFAIALYEKGLLIGNGDWMQDVLQEFKEMEKERMIEFAKDWYFNGPLLGEGIDVKNTIEQHFNKTYGGGEQ